MARQLILRKFRVLTLSAVIVAALLVQNQAIAAQLQLTWADNSNNETGFKIERSTATTGPFSQIATVGANVDSYIDANLANGTTYCYRVRAYNSAGESPYVEACKATVQLYTLTVGKAGSGTGTVASTPTGINCGIACTASLSAGTIVNLTATPSAGSAFVGWSGNADCSDGSVTMSAAKSCTATFNTVAVFSQQPLLPSGGMLLTDPTRYADVNGDGRLDILYFDTKATRGVWVSLATDSGFLAPELWLQHGESTPDQIQYADVNGDGKDDALYFDTLRSRGVWVSLSTGTGFTPAQMWIQYGQSTPDQVRYVDVNGDGKADAVYFDTNISNCVRVSLSSGTGFNPPQPWVCHGPSTPDQIQYADVNGDGKYDALYFDTLRSRGVWVSISTGSAFKPAEMWLQHGDSAPNQIKYADVNGDGRDDALYYDVLRSRGIWVSLSTAIGFTPAQMWLQFSDATADQIQYVDVDGDGNGDVVYDDSTRSGNVWVSLSTGHGFGSALLWPTH